MNNDLNPLYRLAADAHAIVSITDVKGTILHANDMFLEKTGYSRAELIGQNHRIIKSDEHNDEMFQFMWREIARGKIWRGEIKNRRKDGGFCWVKTTIIPVFDVSGKPWRFVGIRTDITERMAAELKLQGVKDKLKHALDVKSDFMSRMNHEIRTPLNGIMGLTEVLGEMAMNAEQAEILKAIQDSSNRLMHLMSNLLDIENTTAFTKPNMQNVSQALIRDRLTDQWLAVATAKGLDFEVSFGDELPDVLIFDFEVVAKVINELLKNAFTHTHTGAVGVHIRASDARTVVTEVSDTGAGIVAGLQERIFEPFVQQDTTNARAAEGAGLGLSVCRQLVEGFGGKITVQSVLGRGSVFSVQLPI